MFPFHNLPLLGAQAPFPLSYNFSTIYSSLLSWCISPWPNWFFGYSILFYKGSSVHIIRPFSVTMAFVSLICRTPEMEPKRVEKKKLFLSYPRKESEEWAWELPTMRSQREASPAKETEDSSQWGLRRVPCRGSQEESGYQEGGMVSWVKYYWSVEKVRTGRSPKSLQEGGH